MVQSAVKCVLKNLVNHAFMFSLNNLPELLGALKRKLLQIHVLLDQL